MRTRLFAFIGCLAVASAGISLAPERLAAQAQKPAAKAAMPRTADGHPDFQGFYDVATMTPVDRPNGAPLVVPREEAAKMEKYEADRQVQNDAPLKGDRGAPPVGGENTTPKSYLEVLEKFGGGVVGGYNNFWLAGGTKLIIVDGQKRSSLIIDPPDGKVPPMKPEAARRNQAFLAGAAAPDASESSGAGPPGAFDGPELRPLAERCLLGFNSTSGPPTLPNYFYNNMKQIVQTKDTILILNEMVHDARVIRMNAAHLPPTIRKWMGDSVGTWDGDTLVVDTTNFTSKTQFRGSSEHLHVVERFTRTGPDTLLYRFTVEDPSTWDRSWTGEYPWNATKENLYEYACHEGNYSLGGMLRGERQKEAEDAAKKSK
ncbi:MAG TPA: hypothetical protein VGX46_03675 [Vicinamibacterales bacterium]|nr:hypothetical protein [Vicinamibacterales bacterium]